MKLNSAVSKFLTNKWVLNVIAFLALFNVIGYLVMGNLNAVVYFIIFAVLVRYFSKNMTIVLGVPLVLVNLLALRGNVLEGMESGSGDTNGRANSTTNPVKKSSTQNNQEKINNIVNKNASSTTSVINNAAASTISTSPDNPAQSTNDDKTDGFEPGRRKNKKYDIDYASTIEDAYDELNNILGSDGIHRLTSDTQNLMKQQMQLAEAMKSMGPMMESLSPMVEQLKGMMGEEGIGNMMDLAKKFTSKSDPAK